jgi:branched-chain amino acid transport system substrate-binding protein
MQQSSRSKMWVVGLVAASLTVLSMLVMAQTSTRVIKIGILAPLSGNSAADGEEMVRGAQLAVKELNAAGGVAGYRFEVVSGDTKDQTPDAVTSAFERISGDKDVHFMATGYASSTNFEIDLMAKINMPYLVSANSAQTRDIIAKAPDKYPTVWSLTPSYDAYETQVLPVIQGLEKQGLVKLPNKKLAIVSSDNPYSKTIFEGIKRSFTRAGWTITVQDLLPFGEINDWRAFLAKVRNDPPAVLINTDYVPANAATFMTQFLENPTNSLVFIQYAPSVPEFLDLTKGKSSGVLYNLLGGVLNTPGNPRAAVVLKKFKDEYKVESGSYGAALYESVLIYADALRRVKDPTNRLAIGRALGATNKQIASGRLVFDPKTHLARQGDTFIPLQFYQLWEGNRVLINPTRYATGKFQAPPWMKR